MEEIVIAGAGPVGLASALFLKRKNFSVRIVDPILEPNLNSRALAINPRTLDLLEPTGITQQIQELGLPIDGAQLWSGRKLLAKAEFTALHPRYPRLIALSQAVTEQLLKQKLDQLGVQIERGVSAAAADAKPYLIATDGAHSSIRHELNLNFAGDAMPDDWHLIDAVIKTELPSNFAHIIFSKRGGFIFMLRVIKNKAEDEKLPPVWRVISNDAKNLDGADFGEVIGEPIWRSKFKISHRLIEKFSQGPIFFAGDSAHLHSPIGARGMNLGIEDAWVLAELFSRKETSQYNQLRHPIDQAVVRKIRFISNVVASKSPLVAWLRERILPNALAFSFLKNIMLHTVAGLDHDLPSF